MNPSVACVCLYADRQQYVQSMLSSFRSQTYENKTLVIYDNGVEPISGAFQRNEVIMREPGFGRTIGEMRNAAAELCRGADIIAHLDSDDWSGPQRLAEQVALLQSTGADAVGFHDMLFWREQTQINQGPDPQAQCSCGLDRSTDGYRNDIVCQKHDGEFGFTFPQAWLYSNPMAAYALGTSLLYWRRTWSTKPFPALPKPSGRASEDDQWIRGLNVHGVSSLGPEPRMIARIHQGNATNPSYAPAGREWSRVPQYDATVNELLAVR